MSKDLAAFLQAAERLLRDKVIAGAQGDVRFAGLMVASALGMAARELALEPRLLKAATGAAEMLAPMIRAGLADGDEALHGRLLADAAVQTSVTRPQFVSDEERRLAGLD